MLSLKELLSSNPPPSAVLLAERSCGQRRFVFLLFPFPFCQDFACSLWAYSPCTDLRATKVWATKLACRNISIKLFRAQHHPGVYRTRGEHAWGTLLIPNSSCHRVQKCVNNLSMCAWRQKEAEGRERRNTNSAKLPCTMPGATPSWSPDYQRGWTRDQYSICI